MVHIETNQVGVVGIAFWYALSSVLDELIRVAALINPILSVFVFGEESLNILAGIL